MNYSTRDRLLAIDSPAEAEQGQRRHYQAYFRPNITNCLRAPFSGDVNGKVPYQGDPE